MFLSLFRLNEIQKAFSHLYVMGLVCPWHSNLLVSEGEQAF